MAQQTEDKISWSEAALYCVLVFIVIAMVIMW
jgi:hypothetical protein